MTSSENDRDGNPEGKSKLRGIGAPAAGAAAGAAIAAGIKYSDDIIESVAGSVDEEETPALDPNMLDETIVEQNEEETIAAVQLSNPPQAYVPPVHQKLDHHTEGSEIIEPEPNNQYVQGNQIQHVDSENSDIIVEPEPQEPGMNNDITDPDNQYVEPETLEPKISLLDSDGDGEFDHVEVDDDRDGVIDATYIIEPEPEEPYEEPATEIDPFIGPENYVVDVEPIPDDNEPEYGDDYIFPDNESDTFDLN